MTAVSYASLFSFSFLVLKPLLEFRFRMFVYKIELNLKSTFLVLIRDLIFDSCMKYNSVQWVAIYVFIVRMVIDHF